MHLMLSRRLPLSTAPWPSWAYAAHPRQHTLRPACTRAAMDAALPDRADAVLAFWFGAAYREPVPAGFWPPPEQTRIWFRGGPETDKAITDAFSNDVAQLAAGAYDSWLQEPLSAVAGIILADQFTRNIYRNSPEAFSLDPKALACSKQLQSHPGLRQLPCHIRYFSYMPLMHSEALEDQEALVGIFRREGEAASAEDPASPAAGAWKYVLTYAVAHRDVVKRWGRFPHRNAILGRPNTPEEAAGLADGSIPAW